MGAEQRPKLNGHFVLYSTRSNCRDLHASAKMLHSTQVNAKLGIRGSMASFEIGFQYLKKFAGPIPTKY